MDIREYFEKYNDVFAEDFAFSRKFASQINRILVETEATLYDYEEHKNPEDFVKDKMGYDRCLKLDIKYGARVRRYDYLEKWFDFTVDFKEWQISDAEIYFYGWADSKESEIILWILFDYKKLKELDKQGKIKKIKQINETHSKVPFWAINFNQLYDYGIIIEFGGKKDYINKFIPKEWRTQRKLTHFSLKRKGGWFRNA